MGKCKREQWKEVRSQMSQISAMPKNLIQQHETSDDCSYLANQGVVLIGTAEAYHTFKINKRGEKE